MGKFLDRTGLRYGRLIVLKCEGKDDKGRYLWLCRCDCGNEKIIVGDYLSSGRVKSCGCLKEEHLKNIGFQFRGEEDRENAILKLEYSHLKKRHKRKKMVGEVIDFDTFKSLVKQPCKYCGMKYSKTLRDRVDKNFTLKINGIDRIDNRIGYTKENSVPCCKICNFAKHTMNENEFYEWIKGFIIIILNSLITCVACEKLGRRWIGIEINPEYCETVKERVINKSKLPL